MEEMANLLEGDLAFLLDLGKLFDGLGSEQRRLRGFRPISLYFGVFGVLSFRAFTYNVKNALIASGLHEVQFRVGMRQNAPGAGTNIERSREVVAEDLSSLCPHR
jgi:hypothetical protein